MSSGGETSYLHWFVFLLPPPGKYLSALAIRKIFSRLSRISSFFVWRRVGQKESPLDSRFISAWLRAPRKGSPQWWGLPGRCSSLSNKFLSFEIVVYIFFCCWCRIVFIRESCGRSFYNYLLHRSRTWWSHLAYTCLVTSLDTFAFASPSWAAMDDYKLVAWSLSCFTQPLW